MNEDTGRTHVIVEDDRTGMHPRTLERAVLDHLFYTRSKDLHSATLLDAYGSVALAVRDRLVHRWIHTRRTYFREDVKRAYYLSAEFLLGQFLSDNLRKLGLWDIARELLGKYDLNLENLTAQEPDPGLGNGGLGRLAACFLDSMATLELPGYGYGIRYEFGIFEQRIRDGWQHEVADAWARYGCPWEVPRYEFTVPVQFYGRVEHGKENGRFVSRWVDTQEVLGVPYDMPVAGYGNNTVNTLRLWSARASKDLNLQVFNAGDYRAAVEEKALSESISKVLYPNDQSAEGRELRLKQQYFFVACSISDILRRYEQKHDSMDAFSSKVAIQLNDTHPAITVAELMRVFLDEKRLEWERAWQITKETVAYTNHTLMVEALERWPVELFERLLPRHLEIIYEINARFLREVEVSAPGDHQRLRRMSIIEEGGSKQIRMAHLAVVGSHSVNGVAQLHSDLVRSDLLSDFAQLWPERFNNKTNGVTPRRWMLVSNPRLSGLITEHLGDGWVKDLSKLNGLLRLADDAEFLGQLGEIKQANKHRLANVIRQTTGIEVDPTSIFDTQIKRIHEYKRQLLNVLHIIALYWRLKDDRNADIVPRTFIFGGKAAPGYRMAKLIVKLIHDVAHVVNHDPAIRGRIKVVFVPNYGVTLAESIIPGSDVSEQISMAGKEASGTGNMKFAMNGALTIGTLDGANIEIREHVGAENFFLFGLTTEEVRALDARGYHPRSYIEQSDELRRVLDSLRSGFFSPDQRDRFRPILEELSWKDTYKHCVDFEPYVQCHQELERVYQDRPEWNRRTLFNMANMGHFSSDRTIREYARDIWDIQPVSVRLESESE